MLYFDYAIEIDERGLRVRDPDDGQVFNTEYMFSRHAWLPGTTFSFEEHPDGGLYLKRIVEDKGL